MDGVVSQRPSPGIQDLVGEALRHHQAGRLAEAERIYRQVLAVDPGHPDGLHLLGMVACQTGDADRAAELIRRAIAVKGDAASYHSNLGNVLESQGNLAEAGACYQRALLLRPELAEVHLNLGNIFRAQSEPAASLACYRRALALNPGLAEAAVAESRVLLLQGEFAAGWPGLERRWQTREFDTPMRAYPQPRWTGGPLASGRLLIWGEQGIGDEVMFASLIPDVLRTGTRCVLDCDARLKPLFARSFPEVDVVAGFDPASHPELEIAAQMPSGSLPGMFRNSVEAFAGTTSPYLVADPIARGRLRERYSDGRRLIGLAWHTKNRRTGRSRSIELTSLAPLFEVRGIRWVSLQYGDHDSLEEEAAAANVPLLVDREVDQLTDPDGFAAQIAAMDLAITIDNSTAHLAGALGVPAWVMLPFAPDWRWLLERDDSPWYPRVRLFRQTRLGDWGSVIEGVRSALDQT
jgi:cytochrome c-type biogenesis protein CcmH/NrfG